MPLKSPKQEDHCTTKANNDQIPDTGKTARPEKLKEELKSSREAVAAIILAVIGSIAGLCLSAYNQKTDQQEDEIRIHADFSNAIPLENNTFRIETRNPRYNPQPSYESYFEKKIEYFMETHPNLKIVNWTMDEKYVSPYYQKISIIITAVPHQDEK